MAPPEGLLWSSQSHFGRATICGFSKAAPAPLLFTEKKFGRALLKEIEPELKRRPTKHAFEHLGTV
jgi:hypothetical protein